MDTLLNQLLTTPGVSGFEERVRTVIESAVDGYAHTSVDEAGNLLATVGSGSPALLFAAHMDETGFLVTSITDDGFLRFRKLGAVDDTVLAGALVTVHGENGDLPGLIGIRPPHLGGGRSMPADSFVIDIGAASSAEAQQMGATPLVPASFRREPRILGGDTINCRSLDDRFGCYALVRACEYAAAHTPGCRVVFAWTAQSEVGLRGARSLLHALDYDVAIPVDACESSSDRDGDYTVTPLSPGDGPALRLVDDASIASRPLAQWLMRLAGRHNIALRSGAAGGSTDGVPLQEAGVPMVPLTIPMRYVHSLAETASISDIEAVTTLLKRIMDSAVELKDLIGRQ